MPDLKADVSNPWKVSRDGYHADRTCVSRLSLEVFRRSIPAYHAEFVAGTAKPFEPSAEMRFGTAFHTFLLEPDKFCQRYHVIPSRPDMRTNVGKEQMRVNLELAAGKELITVADVERLGAMSESVMAHTFARELVETHGAVEVPIRWTDQVWGSGLPMRAMPDKVTAATADGMCFRVTDLKTASDPSPAAFAAACRRYGYARQAATYTEGVRLPVGDDCPFNPEFYFLVVGSEAPHEAYVYELDDDSLNAAEDEVAQLLLELRRCIDFDRWGSRAGDAPLTLSLVGRRFPSFE